MSGFCGTGSTFGSLLISGLTSALGSIFGSDGSITGSSFQSSTATVSGCLDCQRRPKISTARSTRCTIADSTAGVTPSGSSAGIA